jgi:hypothetical protein
VYFSPRLTISEISYLTRFPVDEKLGKYIQWLIAGAWVWPKLRFAVRNMRDGNEQLPTQDLCLPKAQRRPGIPGVGIGEGGTYLI